MSDTLEIKTKTLDDQLYIELCGPIDEDANFEHILAYENNLYVFDFQNISMMNSCGVREWINFIEDLPQGAKLIYKNCPQVLIEQINMVQGFMREGARIDSFYAPYYSEEKDQVFPILLKTEQVVQGKAPIIKHPETGEELEFDAIEAQYFNFIKQQK
jgi:anti-anti-sigma regulatory factor